MSASRIIELPPALCVNNQTCIAALIQRDQVSTADATLYLGKNYSLSGAPINSYSPIQTYRGFAWHGVLISDYPSNTNVVDTAIGARIQLDGPDLILPEVTDYDALAGTYLVFIDDEILALAQPTLINGAVYSLPLVRGRFATPIEKHLTGADVFIISLRDLLAIPLPVKVAGTLQFKVTVGVQNVDDQEAFDVTFSGNAWQLPPPYFVRINGINNLGQEVEGVASLDIEWILPNPGNAVPRSDLVKLSTVLTFIIDGSVAYTTKVSWPETSKTIAWSTISGGGYVPFSLRLTTQIDTDDSVVTGPTRDGTPLVSASLIPTGDTDAQTWYMSVNGVELTTTRDIGADPFTLPTWDLLSWANENGIILEKGDVLSWRVDILGSPGAKDWSASITFTNGSQLNQNGTTPGSTITLTPA